MTREGALGGCQSWCGAGEVGLGGLQPAARAVPIPAGGPKQGSTGTGFHWEKPQQSWGGGTSPTPAPSAKGCSGFGGTPLLLGGRSALLPTRGQEKGSGGRCPPCRGSVGWAGGTSGAPIPPAGPSSRSHGDTHHSTSSESYLRSWRISLIASMVLISLRERMETINKAHMERIIWAASPSPRCL